MCEIPGNTSIIKMGAELEIQNSQQMLKIETLPLNSPYLGLQLQLSYKIYPRKNIAATSAEA